MRVILTATLLCSLSLMACSDREPRGSGARSLPVVTESTPRGSGLLGRLNPFRGRGVAGAGKLCGVSGIEGQVIPPVTSQTPGCGVPDPVQVTHVDGVRLSQPAILDCQTAAALRTWVRKGVRPAVGRTGGGVTELQVAAHYVCRPRNHRPDAPMSEHGRGRAIDISAIRLADGQEMNVLRDWSDSPHSRALRQMHRAACGTFGTTLGPGSDGMHEDHFHYDTARHGVGPICR